MLLRVQITSSTCDSVRGLRGVRGSSLCDIED